MLRLPLIVLLSLSACTADDPPPTSGSGSVSSTSNSPTSGGPAECDSFTTMESCPAPCSWRTFPTYADAAASCEPGDDVSLCVYQADDVAAGCGVLDGCDDAWGYIELADGTRAMAAYCGGTPPEAWVACGPEDIAGGIPECGCACPGSQGSSGGSTGGGSGTATSG